MIIPSSVELRKYSNLLRELVIRDIKKKYRRSVLGILWSMLNPILIMFVMTFVFSNLFRFDIKNFPVYLITGQVIFNFFAESTSLSMSSMIDNGGLIKKVYVPKYLFTLSRVLSSLVNLGFTMPAVLVIVLLTSNPISWHFLLCLVPLALLFVFCLGVGLFLAAIAVYFRDMFHLYGVVLTALNYATPIFYPVTIIPEQYRYLMYFNPLTCFVDAFRATIYYDSIPTLRILAYCAAIAAAALIVGTIFFQHHKDNFILYV